MKKFTARNVALTWLLVGAVLLYAYPFWVMPLAHGMVLYSGTATSSTPIESSLPTPIPIGEPITLTAQLHAATDFGTYDENSNYAEIEFSQSSEENATMIRLEVYSDGVKYTVGFINETAMWFFNGTFSNMNSCTITSESNITVTVGGDTTLSVDGTEVFSVPTSLTADGYDSIIGVPAALSDYAAEIFSTAEGASVALQISDSQPEPTPTPTPTPTPYGLSGAQETALSNTWLYTILAFALLCFNVATGLWSRGWVLPATVGMITISVACDLLFTTNYQYVIFAPWLQLLMLLLGIFGLWGAYRSSHYNG